MKKNLNPNTEKPSAYMNFIFGLSVFLMLASAALKYLCAAAVCPAYSFFGYIPEREKADIIILTSVLTVLFSLCALMMNTVVKKFHARTVYIIPAVQAAAVCDIISAKIRYGCSGLTPSGAYFFAAVYFIVIPALIFSVISGFVFIGRPEKSEKSRKAAFYAETALYSVCVILYAVMFFVFVSGRGKMMMPFIYISPVICFFGSAALEADFHSCAAGRPYNVLLWISCACGMIYHMIYPLKNAALISSCVQTVIFAAAHIFAVFGIYKKYGKHSNKTDGK